MPLICVTGASGYIAKHCIAALLQAGYNVRGTLRDLSKADNLDLSKNNLLCI